jgi:hypothetical protein
MCSRLTGVPVDELADVESTEIGPRWLPQTLVFLKVSCSLNSPTTDLLKRVQTLQGKENEQISY